MFSIPILMCFKKQLSYCLLSFLTLSKAHGNQVPKEHRHQKQCTPLRGLLFLEAEEARRTALEGLTHTGVVVCRQLKARIALAVKGTCCVHTSLVAIWRHSAFIYI